MLIVTLNLIQGLIISPQTYRIASTCKNAVNDVTTVEFCVSKNSVRLCCNATQPTVAIGESRHGNYITSMLTAWTPGFNNFCLYCPSSRFVAFLYNLCCCVAFSSTFYGQSVKQKTPACSKCRRFLSVHIPDQIFFSRSSTLSVFSQLNSLRPK